MKRAWAAFAIAFCLTLAPHQPGAAAAQAVLKAESFQHYVDSFNAGDEDVYPAAIRNTNAWRFLRDNIPLIL